MTNIIFDLGRVLLTFEPRKYLQELYTDPVKIDLLWKAVFGSPTWLDLDRGVVDEEEAFKIMVETAPFPEEIRTILYHWDEMLIPIQPVVEILQRIKEQNFTLYLLSNFHKRAFAKVKQRYAFFKLFDGILISSDTGLVKPDPAIYKRIISDFSLLPEKSLFIDDTPANINAAKDVGMAGLVFHDAAQLERDLYSMSILPLLQNQQNLI